MKTSNPIAVVTSADHPTGMMTARALAGMGIRIIGLYSNANSACLRSKVWAQLHKIDYDARSFCDTLVSLAESLESKATLFACDDASVVLLSENRTELSAHYKFNYPQATVVDALLNKFESYKLAAAAGLDVVPFGFKEAGESLDEVIDRVGLPIIVKPTMRDHSWNSLLPDSKALLVTTYDELEPWRGRLAQVQCPLLVQRWIDGADEDIHFVLAYLYRDQRPGLLYAGRKLLQWPVGTGSTAICRGIENTNLSLKVETFLREVGALGLCSVEFKYSKEDDKYYLIEPTIGRNNLQSYIATAGGVNLTLAAFADLNDDFVPQPRKRTSNVVWVEEKKAYLALIWLVRNKQYRKLSAIMGKLSFKISGCYFSLFDMGPGQTQLRAMGRVILAKFR